MSIVLTVKALFSVITSEVSLCVHVYRHCKQQRIMRRDCKDNLTRLIIITLVAVCLAPMTSSAGARSSRQRNNQPSHRYGQYDRDRQRYGQTKNDINQQDNDYYYYDNEGSCDIEVACRTDTDEDVPPTSMKLPIRGPKGPPGEPGRPGEDGIPGLPGLPGKSFNSVVVR